MTLARDLINTPANDLGPAELEEAARALAEKHGASTRSIVGDDLLSENFPLIHAVGRAAARAPRLIDLAWGDPGHPKITLVGKGVCFDTGGLDIKPDSGMLIMKKDMGGAACVLALAHMVMDARLPVRLRVLIPAVENSISGSAFRPLDVYRSRKGITVEIGNTDAEGRLILADALALADDEAPELVVDMATLTGAARVALGPDLPPFYTDDDALAAELRHAARGRERSAVAHAAVAALRAVARFQDRRHQQRLVGRLGRLDHGGAVPAPLRHPGQGLGAPRHLCLDPDHQTGPARRRRLPGGARALCAADRAVWLMRQAMNARSPRHAGPARPRRPAPGRQGRGGAFRDGRGARDRRAPGAGAARANPRCLASHRGLMGERVTVYETTDEGWAWGQLHDDVYVGWLPAAALSLPGPPVNRKVAALRTLVFPASTIELPPVDALPLGARLAVERTEPTFAVTSQGYISDQHLVALDAVERDFVAVAERFAGVPYLWGGKTSLGIDCSGLVQVALAACGLPCPRDSDMQERALGTTVASDIATLRRGDLIFWKGHVAIVRDPDDAAARQRAFTWR